MMYEDWNIDEDEGEDERFSVGDNVYMFPNITLSWFLSK